MTYSGYNDGEEAGKKRALNKIKRWANKFKVEELYDERTHSAFKPTSPVVFYNDLIELIKELAGKQK